MKKVKFVWATCTNRGIAKWEAKYVEKYGKEPEFADEFLDFVWGELS